MESVKQFIPAYRPVRIGLLVSLIKLEHYTAIRYLFYLFTVFKRFIPPFLNLIGNSKTQIYNVEGNLWGKTTGAFHHRNDGSEHFTSPVRDVPQWPGSKSAGNVRKCMPAVQWLALGAPLILSNLDFISSNFRCWNSLPYLVVPQPVTTLKYMTVLEGMCINLHILPVMGVTVLWFTHKCLDI